MSRTIRRTSISIDATFKPRNPLAVDPILAKGGAHTKSKASERRETDRLIRRELEGRNEVDDGEYFDDEPYARD